MQRSAYLFDEPVAHDRIRIDVVSYFRSMRCCCRICLCCAKDDCRRLAETRSMDVASEACGVCPAFIC